MGVIKLFKEIKSGNGVKWIVCDGCQMMCEVSKSRAQDSESESEEFVCDKCVRLAVLEERVNFLEGSSVAEGIEVSTDCEGLIQGGNTETEGSEVSVVLDYVTKGVVLGDSMVRELGNIVGRVKPNLVRCCLPGAKVRDVIKVAETGGLKVGDKAVLWAGTNNARGSTNVEFKRDMVKLVDTVKLKTGDVRVIGLLPRYKNPWENQRVQVLNRITRAVCEEKEVEFLDVWKACRTDWVKWDGIHLSRIGNREVGKMLLDSLNSKN